MKSFLVSFRIPTGKKKGYDHLIDFRCIKAKSHRHCVKTFNLIKTANMTLISTEESKS